jgi:hypothetical protein
MERLYFLGFRVVCTVALCAFALLLFLVLSSIAYRQFFCQNQDVQDLRIYRIFWLTFVQYF